MVQQYYIDLISLTDTKLEVYNILQLACKDDDVDSIEHEAILRRATLRYREIEKLVV